MQVTELDEQIIQDIGHAFGYYDYGTEQGLSSVFRSQAATAAYIRGYVRMGLRCGCLYTTSSRGEGYIIYKLPHQKLPLRAGVELLKGLCQSMNLKEMVTFLRIAFRSATTGPSLKNQLDKQKKDYIYVGMVCVREKYQGQGYMRKVMDIAFAEGNRLGVPVILDTDAKSKCDKYLHLGMQLTGTHPFGQHGTIYDLVKYPDEAYRS